MGSSNSHLELKTGVKMLLQEDIAMDDHKVWKLIFATQLTYADFSAHINADALRFLRRSRPANLAVLIYKCMLQMQHFVNEGGNVDDQAARNAIGLLGRIFPIIYEEPEEQWLPRGAWVPEEGMSEEEKQKKEYANDQARRRQEQIDGYMVPVQQNEPAATSRYYIDFAQHVLIDNLVCLNEDENAKFKLDRPLGELIIQALVSIAHIPGFTVGKKQTAGVEPVSGHQLVESGLLWCGGVATHPTASISYTDAMLINRRAIIITLTAALSRSLYTSDPMSINALHASLTDYRRTPMAQTFIASMINFIIAYQPRGTMPYTSHFIGGSEDLAIRCAQLLALLGDLACFYTPEGNLSGSTGPLSGPQRSPEKHDETPREPFDSPESSTRPVDTEDDTNADSKSAKSPTSPDGLSSFHRRQSTGAMIQRKKPRSPHDHPFWVFFSNLTQHEVTLVLRGLIRLASNPTYAKSTYLPGSQRTIAYADEFFILIWKLVDRCQNFLSVFCQNDEFALEFMVSLLDFGLEARQDNGRFSALQLTMFFLMRLSAVHDFATRMNAPFNKWLPFDLPKFVGTYNDLLVISMHSLLLCKHQWVQHIHLSAGMVINNLSSTMLSCSQTASSKLISLLEITSTPLYLEGNADRQTIFMYVIEALANIVQYQSQAAAHILYGIVRIDTYVRGIHSAIQRRIAEARRASEADASASPADADEGEESSVSFPISEETARKLHTGTLLCAIDAVQPMISEMLSKDAHADVVGKLSRTTLVGKLPVPHKIITHHFESRAGTDGWLTTWLWGSIYMHAYQPIADKQHIKLFSLTVPQSL